MAYDNTVYWRSLHQAMAGQLRAVGWPMLSEAFNELKYNSEAASVACLVRQVAPQLASKQPVRMLDVGSGHGFWSGYILGLMQELGIAAELTALDISADALAVLAERMPHVQTVCADLKAIPASAYARQFDLVYSCYCLHHLARTNEFIRAVQFSAQSVADNGFLMIMDPVLTLPYSELDAIDFASYQGNGMARHLYLIDDVLQEMGFHRTQCIPAISFLLNSNIQASGRLSFKVCRKLWFCLQRIYRSERLTRSLAFFLRRADSMCKWLNCGFSSSVCLWQKRP